VIADECHRGYTAAELSVWRSTLDHFDAIKVGLTATPAAHTAAYFTHKVFEYPYEQAVRDGHLVDWDLVKVRSAVRMQGVFLHEGENVELVDTETGQKHLDQLEDERDFDVTEVERRVTAPESNRKIVEEIARYAAEHEAATGRFPKTLIFAANDLPHTSHADQLVDLARDVFGRGDAFVAKITGRVDRPLQRIREFRNRPEPMVVVSVDLLTTGVDIPDLEFLVLLRPVKSRILFVQMLGRGTRKGERYPDKEKFTVFDCFDGTLVEYFKQSTDMTADLPAPPGRTIPEIIEAIWRNEDRRYNTVCLVKRLQRVARQMSGEARDLFASYIEAGDVARFARELPRDLLEDFSGTMKLLRDPKFQELLESYPRAKRTFVNAFGYGDTVTSAWLIRDGLGNEHRPEDYLSLFSRFVQENVDQIDAIRILLGRQRGWSAEALLELRTKLKTSEYHFTEANLERAFARSYQKSLVDLISMVKRASDEGSPLLTAAERVDRALARVTAGRVFTAAETLWLDRIREVLRENLSIARTDFDDLPALSHPGGWGAAEKVFGQSRLERLLSDLNEAVAA
jgi:type I restriction enzyme, R subunit